MWYFWVQKRKRTKEEKKEREWRQTELKALEEVLLLYGDGETQKLRARVRSLRLLRAIVSGMISCTVFDVWLASIDVSTWL